MSETLSFSVTHLYDTRKTGITVDAVLRSGGYQVEVVTKVDTGASFCIFRRSFGEMLGLEIESGSPEIFGTATGRFVAYGHELKLWVLGIETVATVYFAADPNFTRNVLGRQGWLDHVRLGLIDYEGKLLLSSYDEPNS